MKLIIHESPTGMYSLTVSPQLPSEVEMKKLTIISNIVHERFQFKPIAIVPSISSSFFQYEDKKGEPVYIALDEYDGLSVESKNLEFIEQMKVILETEVLVELLTKTY